MREHKYILNEQGEPVPEPDVIKWGKWFEENRTKKRIAYDEIEGIKISTIFLGLDYSWIGELPMLWETMVFGGVHDEYQERYSSRAEAEAGHAVAVALVKASLLPEPSVDKGPDRKFKPEI